MAKSVTISSGTALDVMSGQSESGDTILNGGTLDVDAGGDASGTIILGTETVLEGGSDRAASIGTGGLQLVYGKAAGAVVGSGGLQIVASGGTASDAIIQGGTLDLQAGGARRQQADGGWPIGRGRRRPGRVGGG